MSMVCIQRRERFSAAHQLYNPNWSEEQNEAVFGRCANKHYHGHNFSLIVTVKGRPNPETGFVMNLFDLKQLIRVHIIDWVDHRNLNTDVPFMQGKMASTEVLAIEFWKILKPLIQVDGPGLYCIRLEETENNFVEYYGEEA